MKPLPPVVLQQLLQVDTRSGDGDTELFENLLEGPAGLRLERIVSTGQTSPPGFWYDQNETEWVLLLQGRATLQIEGQDELTLEPGHALLLPAHRRHRVTYTQAHPPTLWLALFWQEPAEAETPK